MDSDALRALGDDWLPVTLVSAATLGISLGAGRILARYTALDVPTATLGMIAGGASGIVTMADDLGGDDRLVAFMQYLRVLIVVLLTPLLIAAFGGGGGGSAGPHEAAFGDVRGLGADRGASAPARRCSPGASACPPGPCSARCSWPAR